VDITVPRSRTIILLVLALVLASFGGWMILGGNLAGIAALVFGLFNAAIAVLAHIRTKN
jgi:hypothetical protein